MKVVWRGLGPSMTLAAMTTSTIDVQGAYVAMVFLTVATPGPGQILTIRHATELGWRAAMLGVLGLCVGTVLMSGLSLLSLAGLLLWWPQWFTLLKWAGAAILMRFAWQSWRAAATAVQGPVALGDGCAPGAWVLLRRGLMLQTVNPKPVLFFLAVLPPVALDAPSGDLVPWRAAGAVGVYLCALLLIHGGLAAVAVRLRQARPAPGAVAWLRRGSAVCLGVFALLLIAS